MKVDQQLLIESLIKERDELIASNPELAEFQREIDRQLEHIRDPLERAAKVNQMLIKMMTEKLLPAMSKLREVESEVKILEFQKNKKKVG